MKLARIEHDRCNEFDCHTFVWIPDVMERDEFNKIVKLAQEEYLKAESEFKRMTRPLDPGYSPQYDKYPNKTVAEVKTAFDEARIIYTEYEKKLSDARLHFCSHLIKASGDRIKSFWDGDFLITSHIDWGHRHGENLNYKEKSPDDFDLEGSQKYPERW